MTMASTAAQSASSSSSRLPRKRRRRSGGGWCRSRLSSSAPGSMLRMLLGTGPLPPPGKGGRGRRGGGAFLEPSLGLRGAENCGDSAVAVYQRRRLLLLWRRGLSPSSGFPSCRTFGGRCSCCARSSSFSAMACAGLVCLCSLDCRPFVADNVGSTRLVLLVTKHLTLYSLFSSSGPRCAASCQGWTRRTVTRCIPVVVQRPIPMVFCSEDHRNSPIAPQHGDRCPCCTGRAGFLVSGSHLYDIRCSPVEYRIMDLSGRSQEWFRYSTLLGSTVDTCSGQSTRRFGRISHV